MALFVIYFCRLLVAFPFCFLNHIPTYLARCCSLFFPLQMIPLTILAFEEVILLQRICRNKKHVMLIFRGVTCHGFERLVLMLVLMVLGLMLGLVLGMVSTDGAGSFV